MSIVSRELRHVRPQRDGTVRVQERLTDSKGRVWFHSYKAASEAEAMVAMNARDMTAQLKDREELEAVDFIKASGDPSTFVRADLTNTEFNRRLVKRFAELSFDGDSGFLRKVAGYIAGFTATQIASALGITRARAQVVLDRAVHIRDTVDVALTTDAGRVQEDIG